MKEETRKNVSLAANIINSTALVMLGVFGYLVSSDVRTIQRKADQRAKAKQAQEFWNDMNTLAQVGADKSGALGSAITTFILSGGKLLDNYQRVYKFNKQGIVNDDAEYNASLASFFSKFFDVRSKIEAVANEFDSSRLKYTTIAQEHHLEAWEKFFYQTEQVRAWKENVLRVMTNYQG